MSGKWNYDTQRWEDDEAPANPTPTSASFQPITDVNVPLEPVAPHSGPKPLEFTNPQPVEPTIEEHAMFIRSAFDKIMSKAVESTELAKRVAELEALCNGMEAQLHGLAADLEAEKRNHTDTQRRLQEVQKKLDHEQRAVHDLVMERDIVVEERNKAQQERDAERDERGYNRDWAERVERQLEEERQRSHVLEERCSTMQSGVNALKAAIAGLQSL